jgi:hypothetical protein
VVNIKGTKVGVVVSNKKYMSPVLQKDLEVIKGKIEKFVKKHEKHLESEGFYFLVAMVHDKMIMTKSVQFVSQELSVNTSTFEVAAIHKNMAKKWKDRDVIENRAHKFKMKREFAKLKNKKK